MFSFTLNATFNAPITDVYDAFHRTDILLHWFAPGDLFVSQAMSDFKEGGRYRIAMNEPTGQHYTLTGQYVKILTNEKLVFTWAWEDNLEQSIITNVEVSFVAKGDSTTEVTIVHGGFANQAECDQHQYGWVGCLEKLSTLDIEALRES